MPKRKIAEPTVTLPATIEICGQPWRIIPGQSRSDGVLGECNARDRTLMVDVTASDDIISETMLHELIHGCLEASGGNYGLHQEIEERVIYTLAPALLAALQRNWEVLSVLLQVPRPIR